MALAGACPSAAASRSNHPGLCSLVLQVRDLLPRSDRDDVGRGIDVEPSTIMRWVHRFGTALEKRVHWYQGYRATSWASG